MNIRKEFHIIKKTDGTWLAHSPSDPAFMVSRDDKNGAVLAAVGIFEEYVQNINQNAIIPSKQLTMPLEM